MTAAKKVTIVVTKSSKRRMVQKILGFGSLIAIVGAIAGLYLGGYLDSKCHTIFPDTINHLGTKTPYVYNTSGTTAEKPNESCSAEQIWMIVRHGSRLPGAEVITRLRTELPVLRDRIIKNHEEGRGTLCHESLKIIKAWVPHPGFKESEEKYLIPQGEVEIDGIATRYKERFPNLFTRTYSKTAFKLKYTKTQRAEASANSFAKALFNDKHKDVVYPTAVKADPVLRFYKTCEKWQRDVDDNPEAYNEREVFEKSELFQTALRNIQERLGFQRNLSISEVELMFTSCAFETAWHPEELSNWCTIFDENDLRLFEYRSDVKYYWIDGYGYNLTYEQACAPVNDVIEHFQEKISNPTDSPQVIAYFTHSGTLLKLLARYGLFNDSIPLLGSNYHLHSERKWKTGHIDKFATNLAFVLFKCQDEYKVGTYFQEKSVFLDACEDNYCTFGKFKTNLRKTINKCDVEGMCKI